MLKPVLCSMKFKISNIPDQKSQKQIRVAAADIDLDDVPHEDVYLELEFQKMPDAIQLSFTASTTLRLRCDRSLEYFDFPVESQYQVLFKSEVQQPEEDEEQSVKPLLLSSNEIDIEQQVRDSILLSIPIKALHPRFIDENGLPTPFSYVSEDPAAADDPADDDGEPPVDPRWEALRKLK